jgi:cytoskeleton protein RodZ
MTSLGEQLRLARRAKSKSLEDVSNDTNISKRYLEALEEDNYDIFPSQVYVRGFLSVYAECVGLDSKAVVEQYKKLITYSKLLDRQISERVAHRRGTRRVIRKRLLLVLIALLLTILCLAALLWLRRT